MDLTMPRLSDTMEEGTVGRWLKAVGDPIEKGEVIAEIQTDKANMELEAFQSGVLEEILVKEGETVAIGEPIAVIGSGAGKAVGTRTTEPAAARQPAQEAPTVRRGAAADTAEAGARPAQAPAPSGNGAGEPQATGAAGGRIKASPLARRIAQELGVELSTVRGTGPNGRINREDVERAAAPAPTTPTVASDQPAPPVKQPPSDPESKPAFPVEAPAALTAGEVRPLSRMQRIIVERMVQSKTQAPHFYVTAEIDMAKAIKLREEINALGGQAVSFNDIVVKGCALALKAFPIANASYTPEGIRYNAEINIGVAVAIEGGLIVPVVRNADGMPLRQIAADTRALVVKARENRLTPEDLSGGTFTVSNLGMYGVDEFIAIINQPQAAILAVGAIGEQPVVENGQVTVGHRMRVTLSSDHRVLYGAHAAEFLRELKRLIESPLNLGY